MYMLYSLGSTYCYINLSHIGYHIKYDISYHVIVVLLVFFVKFFMDRCVVLLYIHMNEFLYMKWYIVSPVLVLWDFHTNDKSFE